jgi:hypothetical protein
MTPVYLDCSELTHQLPVSLLQANQDWYIELESTLPL